MALGLQRIVLQVAFIPLIFVLTLPFRDVPSADLSLKKLHTKTCNYTGYKCWQLGLLPHDDNHCYQPLKNKPCLEGFWFVLDEGSAFLKGKCTRRPCGDDDIPLGDTCLNRKEAATSLCAGSTVHLDVTGQPFCVTASESLHFHKVVVCARQEISSSSNFGNKIKKRSAEARKAVKPIDNTANITQRIVWTNNISCVKDDQGLCLKDVVEATTSEPFILSPETK